MTVLGRYTITSRLAVGGMAEVFAATMGGAEGFVKPVVVKRLLPHLCSKPEVVRLFLNEARIAAQFSHPNLAQVYELFEAGGSYCIAMEQLDGVDLHELQRRLPDPKLTPAAVCEIIASVAAGLQVAHATRDAAGKPVSIIHRDVSPTNIFVTRNGVVKLVDFGVAKLLDSQAPTERRGKPRYMSPEQIRGDVLDGRSDLFALGAVAYELLTGTPCFDGETLMEVAEAINNGRYAGLSLVSPSCDAQLAGLIERLLAADRNARPATADDVRREARQISGRIAGAGYTLLDDIDANLFGTTGEITHKTGSGWLEPLRGTPTKPSGVPITEDLVAAVAAPTVIAKGERRSRTRLLAAAAVAGTGLAVILVMAWRTGDGETQAAPTAMPAVEPEVVEAVAEVPVPSAAVPPVPTQRPVPTPVLAPVAAAELPRTQPLRKSAKARIVHPPPRKEAILGTGSLVVNSEPWSDVYLDGAKVGITPLALHAVSEGNHELLFRNDAAGLKARRDVQVRPNETTKAFERFGQPK